MVAAMATEQEMELTLDPPHSVVYGRDTVRCGETVYRALRCLMSRERGAGLPAFCTSVWGKAEVHNETVRSLIWRTNNLLKGLRCPRRVMLSGDKVLFE